MTDEAKSKDTFSNWLIGVALWMALILFSMNQGAQIVQSFKSERFTMQAGPKVTCAVVIEGSRQSMRCFADE